MEEVKNKQLEMLLADAEKEDWNYTIYQEPKGTYNGWYCNERNYVELRKYSPSGEDFSMIIDFDTENPIDSFLKNLKEYSDEFDVDEHVKMWIPERGDCPKTQMIQNFLPLTTKKHYEIVSESPHWHQNGNKNGTQSHRSLVFGQPQGGKVVA